MRTIFELSHEEVIALTPEALQRYIDIERAKAGIPFIAEPVAPQAREVEIEPERVYTFSGLYSQDKELIQMLADIFEEHREKWLYFNYDYSLKVAFISKLDRESWAKPQFKIHQAYKSEYRPLINDTLRFNKNEQERYEKECTAFEENTKEAANIADRVRELYSRHRQAEFSKKQMIAEAARYLDLAEGNKEIARKFFNDAYPHCNDWIKWHIQGVLGGTEIETEPLIDAVLLIEELS